MVLSVGLLCIVTSELIEVGKSAISELSKDILISKGFDFYMFYYSFFGSIFLEKSSWGFGVLGFWA